jgi:energy-converting hydrogenase Eha subunit B
MIRVLRTHSESLAPNAPAIVVVNDRRDLYPEILERSGLRLVERLERHVNRRTGRRAGEYFESILVCVRET